MPFPFIKRKLSLVMVSSKSSPQDWRHGMATFYIQHSAAAPRRPMAPLSNANARPRCTAASESASADVVVVNTCTVTASADAQARDAIRKLHAANPAARVIVTGCYASAPPESSPLFPGVSWVVGNSHKPQIPALLQTLSSHPSNFLHQMPFFSRPLWEILWVYSFLRLSYPFLFSNKCRTNIPIFKYAIFAAGNTENAIPPRAHEGTIHGASPNGQCCSAA